MSSRIILPSSFLSLAAAAMVTAAASAAVAEAPANARRQSLAKPDYHTCTPSFSFVSVSRSFWQQQHQHQQHQQHCCTKGSKRQREREGARERQKDFILTSIVLLHFLLPATHAKEPEGTSVSLPRCSVHQERERETGREKEETKAGNCC